MRSTSKTAAGHRRCPTCRLITVLVALLLAGCDLAPSAPTPPGTPVPQGQIVSTPVRSAGCGQPAPAPIGKSTPETIHSGGVPRAYLLHIPPGYQNKTPTPLVLNFHGHGSNAAEQQARSGMSLLADQQGFVVVYPQGLVGAGGQTGWATQANRTRQVNDVLFVSDLLNQLQAELCINPQRIYATGFSNGGGMTNVLACTMAGRVAAFAPVSGSYPPYPGGCHPARPVPILELHGTADPVVPYNGSTPKQYPPVLNWLKGWAGRDGCTVGPTTFYEQGNLTGLEWTACQANVSLIHYRITGEGHVWPHVTFHPPGGSPGQAPTASGLIWAFFQQYPLPGSAQ